jgi:hypothetical protein
MIAEDDILCRRQNESFIGRVHVTILPTSVPNRVSCHTIIISVIVSASPSHDIDHWFNSSHLYFHTKTVTHFLCL